MAHAPSRNLAQFQPVPPSRYRTDLLHLIAAEARHADVRSYFLALDFTVWELDALLREEGITFPHQERPKRRDGISPERRAELQELSLGE